MLKHNLLQTLITACALLTLLLGGVGLMVEAQGPPRERGGGSSDEGGGGGGSSGPSGADIIGTITDLTTGNPGDGLFVRVNDILVRADARGKWSLTGMGPGTYYVSLADLPAGLTPVQAEHIVTLADSGRVVVDLEFYSGPPPTLVPSPTVVISATLAPVVEAVATATATVTTTVAASPTAVITATLPPVAIPAAPPVAELPGAGETASQRPGIAPAPGGQPIGEAVLAAPPLAIGTLCGIVYTIQPGDSLESIAEIFLGSRAAAWRIIEVTAISRAENGLFADVSDPSQLSPGAQLCIPPR